MANFAKEGHWRDRAITASEKISDAFDVAKAYGAHIANWVLFFCLVANLIEMVSPPFQAAAGMAIVGIQSIMLDVAGFGLTAMASSARRRGDKGSALKAEIMGWTLIGVMAVTVTLITLAAFDKRMADFAHQADNWLMLTRVIVTVFYGHIVHQIREASTEHENRMKGLEKEVSSLRVQLDAKEQEVSSGQATLRGVQSQISALSVQLEDAKQEVSTLQKRLDTERQKASTLEQELSTGQGDTSELRRALNMADHEIKSLSSRLSLKQQEIDQMLADQDSVTTLRRELHAARVDIEQLQAQLSSEQKLVSTLKKELNGKGVHPSSGQKKSPAVQSSSVDTGQHPKITRLDTNRKKTGRNDQIYGEQIQQLLISEPGISGRAIATRLGCSPTTASEWKKFFEDGGQLDEGERELVNE